MSDRDSYFKLFRNNGKSIPDAERLADEYARVPYNYFADMFKFFRDNGKSIDQAISLVHQFDTTRYGRIPKVFTDVLYKLFRNNGKSIDDSINLVLKYYVLTEADGWPVQNDELIKDLPEYFQFFRSQGKTIDQSLVDCERVMKGVGRLKLSEFKKVFTQERNKGKTIDQSLDVTFGHFNV